MAKAEGYKIPSKEGKNEIISAIKKQYEQRNKTKTWSFHKLISQII